jgi:hypothetical protein
MVMLVNMYYLGTYLLTYHVDRQLYHRERLLGKPSWKDLLEIHTYSKERPFGKTTRGSL